MQTEAIERELRAPSAHGRSYEKQPIRKKDAGRRCHLRGRDSEAIRPAGNQNQHARSTVPDDKRVTRRRSDRCLDPANR